MILKSKLMLMWWLEADPPVYSVVLEMKHSGNNGMKS